MAKLAVTLRFAVTFVSVRAAVATAFRDAGAQVTITGTRGSAADYAEDLHGFRYLQLDVEDRAGIDAVAAAVSWAPLVDAGKIRVLGILGANRIKR